MKLISYKENGNIKLGKYESSIGKKKTDELAVMIDTIKPLHVTEAALGIDDKNYPLSWLN